MNEKIHRKQIVFEIKIIEFNKEYSISSTKFVYKDKTTSFTDNFTIEVNNLHDILFGCVKIIFLRKGFLGDFIFGGSKIDLKRFLKGDGDSEVTVSILNKADFDKAAYYNPSLKAIGKMKINVLSKTLESLLSTKTDTSFIDRIFHMCFSPNKTNILKKILNLLMEAHSGTIICNFWAVMGVLPADYYYTFIYGACTVSDCNGRDCKKEFCQKGYIKLSDFKIKESLEWLQMAAAGYGDSFPTWNLKTPVKIKNVNDKRLKSILERLNVNESQLEMDYKGDEFTPGFISCYKKSFENCEIDTLVISFKGTTTGLEALYDLECNYVEFQDGYTHHGIKKLADGFLEKFWKFFEEKMKQKDIKKIYLAGHSLGAATAILVHLRIVELHKEYFVKTVCFSSPPVVSENIAARKNTNIEMWSYGVDIVTRLSYGSILDLKYFCISVSSMYRFIGNRASIDKTVQEIRDRIRKENTNPKLYHPGSLYHIKKHFNNGKNTFGYKLVDHKFFSEIILAKTSPLDHLMHHFLNAFNSSLEK